MKINNAFRTGPEVVEDVTPYTVTQSNLSKLLLASDATSKEKLQRFLSHYSVFKIEYAGEDAVWLHFDERRFLINAEVCQVMQTLFDSSKPGISVMLSCFPDEILNRADVQAVVQGRTIEMPNQVESNGEKRDLLGLFCSLFSFFGISQSPIPTPVPTSAQTRRVRKAEDLDEGVLSLPNPKRQLHEPSDAPLKLRRSARLSSRATLSGSASSKRGADGFVIPDRKRIGAETPSGGY